MARCWHCMVWACDEGVMRRYCAHCRYKEPVEPVRTISQEALERMTQQSQDAHHKSCLKLFC